MNTFRFRKRVFLEPVSTGSAAYVLAEVESSRGGEYKWGHYMLSLADGYRRIELECFMHTLRARRRSLAKIDLLIKLLNAFRAALDSEAKLMTEYEKKDKRERLGKARLRAIHERNQTAIS